MGVHRNYSSVGKFKKVLILFRIVIETVLSITVYCKSFFVFSPRLELREHVSLLMTSFHFAFLLNGFCIIACAVQSSQAYKIFISDFMDANYTFFNFEIYKKYIKQFKKNFILSSSTYSILNIILVALRIHVSVSRVDVFYTALFLIELYFEIRFILEIVILYTYISILKYFVETMNVCICDIKAKYNNVLEKSQNSHEHYGSVLTVKQLEEWAMKYARLERCSNKLSECFSSQVNKMIHKAIVTGISLAKSLQYLVNMCNEYLYYTINICL